jgi:microcompartment protein CcmK/EutM
MLIARVTGLVVATMKHASLTGSKLLIVEETDVTGKWWPSTRWMPAKATWCW